MMIGGGPAGQERPRADAALLGQIGLSEDLEGDDAVLGVRHIGPRPMARIEQLAELPQIDVFLLAHLAVKRRGIWNEGL